MAKLTWRLSLLSGLALLVCGYCILLGGVAGLTNACYDLLAGGPSNSVKFLQWCASYIVCCQILCAVKFN